MKIASRRRRFLGWLFDYLTFMLIISVVFFLFPIFEAMENVRSISEIPLSFYVAFIILIGIYFLRDSISGKSLGKYIMGLAVRDNRDQNKPPSALRLISRNLTLLFWPLECLIIIFNSKKKRLGDILTGSSVIQIAPTKKLYVLLFIPVFIGFFLTTISLVIKKSDAYQVATVFLTTNDKVKEHVGEVEGFGMFPSGEIQIQNGYGQAVMSISIHGSKTNANAQVLLSKDPGAIWMVRDFRLQ